MAHLTIAGYRPGIGVLHAMDVRFKLGAFLVLVLAVVAARPLSLALLTVALIPALHRLKIGLGSLVTELRYFLVLLLLVVAARALVPDIPGYKHPLQSPFCTPRLL